jgi:hypothetical protein
MGLTDIGVIADLREGGFGGLPVPPNGYRTTTIALARS